MCTRPRISHVNANLRTLEYYDFFTNPNFILFLSYTTHSICLDAKHVNKKAARKSNHTRPRKSRPSDINRKAPVYPSFEKPPEYTISDAPATPVVRMKKEE